MPGAGTPFDFFVTKTTASTEVGASPRGIVTVRGVTTGVCGAGACTEFDTRIQRAEIATVLATKNPTSASNATPTNTGKAEPVGRGDGVGSPGMPEPPVGGGAATPSGPGGYAAIVVRSEAGLAGESIGARSAAPRMAVSLGRRPSYAS